MNEGNKFGYPEGGGPGSPEQTYLTIQIGGPYPSDIKSEPYKTEPIIEHPGWRFASRDAAPFIPKKKFPTEVELLWYSGEVPRIVTSPLAQAKMSILIGAIDLEVGWLGTARKEGNTVFIDDVFLFEQDVSYGHSELDTDSLHKFVEKALERPDGVEIFNNTKFWGHSHGSGGTHPSTQDDKQMQLFRNNRAEFFLRGIFNRSGEINYSLYDWENGIIFHYTPWSVGDKGKIPEDKLDELFIELRTEMKRMVIYNPPPPPPQPTKFQTFSTLPPYSATTTQPKGDSKLNSLLEFFGKKRRK